MKNGYIINTLFAICATAAVMTSCKDKDVYDHDAREKEIENLKKQYAINFESRYGSVAGKSWDFTTGRTLATRGSSDGISLEVIEGGFDFAPQGDWITKNQAIYDAIGTTYSEGDYHRSKPMVLVSPGNAFYIFPLTTRSMYEHDLMVRVGDNKPVKLYHKSWTNYSRQWPNGMYIRDEQVKMPGLRVEAPVGTPIEIYLANVNDDPKDNMGTTNGYACYVDVPADVEVELPAECSVSGDGVLKYLGFEDERDGDHDCNDMVMLIVGDLNVPEEAAINDNTYEVATTLAKRYMVEDLGTTNDFDFNDVVVDVSQDFTEKHKVTVVDDVIDCDVVIESVASEQKAVVRALGGTLDFLLTIGSSTWTKSGAGFNVKTMYNTGVDNMTVDFTALEYTEKGFMAFTYTPIDYNKELATFEVRGWEPSQNNVSLKVRDSKGDIDISFPTPGTAPMIIAVDTNKKWMRERESIPKPWFN